MKTLRAWRAKFFVIRHPDPADTDPDTDTDPEKPDPDPDAVFDEARNPSGRLDTANHPPDLFDLRLSVVYRCR
jgi:hypothetical protein